MQRDHALQLRAALREGEAPAWRRLVVPSWLSLDDLHVALQCAFGWERRHRYVFRADHRRYALPEENEIRHDRLGDAEFTLLGELELGAGSRLVYVYDFAEHWRHELEVEAVLEPEATSPLPTCLGGAGAGPGDDGGGEEGRGAVPFDRDAVNECLEAAFRV